MARSSTAALLGLAAIAGCTATKEAPPGLGKAVVSGPVRAFSASPDGAWLALLDGCRDARSSVLPPQTASCTLRVVASGGGAPKRIADAVTTLPYGLAWSKDGALAALASYDYASASGALVLWRGGEPRTLASGVSFHGFGPAGELGFVAAGRLSVLVPGEAEPRAVKGADRVASFELSPSASCAGDALRLAAREVRAAGGRLLVAGCGLREARPIEAGQVADYGFSRATGQLAYTVQQRGGAELKLVHTEPAVATRVLGKGARTFAFGPSGKAVAFLCDAAPGKQGDLHVAGDGEKPLLLARDVGELAWARDADRLAWLERYDPRVRSGTLGAGGPGAAARAVAENVSDFDLSPDGRRVAFLQHTTRGGYSVDLGFAQLDGPAGAKAATVAQGVFGFAFSPDGRWLYYRTRCVRNAEACDLDRIPADGPGPGAKPESVAVGVKSFDFDPRDPGRLLVTWQRMDAQALDVAVWKGGKMTAIDTYVSPGSAQFLGPDSRRVAYVVQQRKREGLYVAELPR